MAAFASEALVLRAVDFGESDLVVHLLLPGSGRLAAIAKGARRSTRRFPGVLDLFNHLRVEIERSRRGALARLEHARLLDAFVGLRADARRFALGCFLLELLDRLAPEGAARRDAERLFGFAVDALAALETARPDRRTHALLELQALAALGLRPELRRCVRCGREIEGARAIAFHVPEGGPVCAACSRAGDAGVPVHLGTLRALEHGADLPLDRIERLALPQAALDEAVRLLDRFQRFHLGVDLRSREFLERALDEKPPSFDSPGAVSH
ncbi:MAG TPA: DNA repair protein RecO [Myxococcota bacterium]|nr:DNA repair protein RecO [Myxococcota bacterium]